MHVASPQDSAALQQLVDDELARAPLLIDEVLQSVSDSLLTFEPSTPTSRRQALGGRRDAIDRARPDLVRAFSQALRSQLKASTGAPAPQPGRPALVDADAIDVEVALQRTVDVIRRTAEQELRELDSLTSAMTGGRELDPTANPLRPETFAQALLAAVRALPGAASEQLALLQLAAPPLARALRQAYAAACGRLADQGIEPAAFRTLAMPGAAWDGSRLDGMPVRPPVAPASAAQSLNALRDSMPMPLDGLPPADAGLPSAPPASHLADHGVVPANRSATTQVDGQIVELLTRLFQVITHDPSLPGEVQRLLSMLQASAARVALRDPAMLEAYDHPVWNFIDQLAFDAERLQGDDDLRQRFLRYAEGLIGNLVAESSQGAALYRWGGQRLKAHQEHLLVQHRKAAQSQIEALRTHALALDAELLQALDRESRGPWQEGVLDAGSLDTVPADLLDVPAALAGLAPHRPEPALETGPGDWLSLFLQGRWRALQLLWTDGSRRLFLFRQAGGETWALHRDAMERLEQAGLMEPLEPPSLVQHAAAQVLRDLPGGAAR